MAKNRYRSGPDFRNIHIKDERRKRRSRLLFLAEILLVIAAAFLAVFFFGCRTTASDDAMTPTIEEGDTVVLNRLSVQLGPVSRGAVAAFYPNGSTDGRLYLRRVVGIPGDTVQIIDGVLYCNDEEVELASGNEITVAGLAEDAIVLGEDEYFVIGDNPNDSDDSRHINIGLVSRDDMVGTVWLIVSPIGRIGLVN